MARNVIFPLAAIEQRAVALPRLDGLDKTVRLLPDPQGDTRIAQRMRLGVIISGDERLDVRLGLQLGETVLQERAVSGIELKLQLELLLLAFEFGRHLTLRNSNHRPAHARLPASRLVRMAVTN